MAIAKELCDHCGGAFPRGWLPACQDCGDIVCASCRELGSEHEDMGDGMRMICLCYGCAVDQLEDEQEVSDVDFS